MLSKIFNLIKNREFNRIYHYIDWYLGFGLLERLWYSNWFNPLLTLYFNFRSLGIGQAIRFPIYIYGRPKFINLTGSILITGRVRPGMVKFNKKRLGSPSNESKQTEINNCGIIVLGGGYVGCGCKIVVNQKAKLTIGNGFEITDDVLICCHKEIFIGENCSITHRCQVYDTNFHYTLDIKSNHVGSYIGRVIIGNNVWVCNSSSIMKSSVIPDGSIIASNSLVNSDITAYGQNCLYAGTPVKLVRKNIVRVFDECLITDIHHFYNNTENEGVYQYKYK